MEDNFNKEFATNWEEFTLPSLGKIYDPPIDPHVRLRSMTTSEEMKRLSPTETPYKIMSDIIEDCMETKPKIKVCDMSIGDYQFLLHKLRIVTYTNKYKMLVTCPKCGHTEEMEINLDSLKINEWNESISSERLLKLPASGKLIELRFQTPHDLDLIAYRAKEMKKARKIPMDYSILFTLMSLINKIDGQSYTDEELKSFVENMPMRDVNYILTKAAELTKKVGIDNVVDVTCTQCGFEVSAPFRITSEFFGPTED